jgi:hypothetical protein
MLSRCRCPNCSPGRPACSRSPGARLRPVHDHRAPQGARRGLGAPVPAGVPGRRAPAGRRGAGAGGLAVGGWRAGGGDRAGRGVRARDARAGPGRRRPDGPAGYPPPTAARNPAPPPRPRLPGPGRHPRPLARGRAAGRAGDRGGTSGRLGVPGPRTAAARPVSGAVPVVLPQPGPSRLVHGRAADHGRGGSGGLGRRAAAGPAAARGRGHRLGARPPVRRLPDRPGVPASRLAVEVDGWAWHVDAARFRADRRKGNAVTRAGWDLLRFTWHDLDSRPSETVSEIAQTLARAA